MYNWNKLKRRENTQKKWGGKACSIVLLLEHWARRCPDSSSAESKRKTRLNVEDEQRLGTLDVPFGNRCSAL